MKNHNKTVIGNRLELLRILKIMPKLIEMPQVTLCNYILIYNRIYTDFDYFVAYSQDDPGKVSYAATFDVLNSEKRIKTSFTRFLRRKMKVHNDMIGDVTLDLIGREVISNVTDINDVIRIESDILSYYESGFGGGSCMTGEDNQRYLDLYCCNLEKVQILIYKGSTNARALLWTTDNGTRVLDRIYPNDGGHVNIIYEYCKANDIVFRTDNHLPEGDSITLSDGQSHTITLNLPDNGLYPFLDTFHFGEIGIKLYLSNDSEDKELTFDSTGGEYSYGDDEDSTTCDSCGDRHPSDEISCIDDMCLCQDCFDDNYSCCEKCDETCPNDDIRKVYNNENDEYWCQYCASTDACCCEKCNDYYTEVIECGGHSYCPECAETELALCDSCEEYELADDIVHLEVDDIYVCKYCANEAKKDQEKLNLESEVEYKVLLCSLKTNLPFQVSHDRL